MPYNPGVTDISGQLRAQGMVNQAQGIGQGVANFAEQFAKSSEENAKFNAKNKAMENLVKTHAELFGLTDPEKLKGFLDTNPRESPIARYERLSTLVEGTVAAKKIQQMEEAKKGEAMQRQIQQMQIDAAKQKMAQDAKDSQAIAAALGQFMPRSAPAPAGEAVLKGGFGTDITGLSPVAREVAPPPFNPIQMMQQALANGASPAALDKIDALAKMAMPPKPGPALGPIGSIHSTDEKGNPIIVSVDRNTGQRLGSGPTQRLYPSPEEAAATESAKKTAELSATSADAFVKDVVNSAEQARMSKATLNRIEDLYKAGAESGFGQSWLTNARALGAQLGRKDAKLATQQELEVLLNETVFGRTQQFVKGQGAVSDTERRALEAAMANPNRTKEANLAILRATKAIADRAEKLEAERLKLEDEGVSQSEIHKRLLRMRAKMPIAAISEVANEASATALPAGWTLTK